MEKILYEVGLQDFISICHQKSISIKTFEYIMSPESSALTRKIVCQDTGLNSSQIVDICGQIQKAKAKGQLPSSRSPFQTKSKALTGVYGRSNRIQKLVALPNAVKPGFAHYSAPQPMIYQSQQQQNITHNQMNQNLLQITSQDARVQQEQSPKIVDMVEQRHEETVQINSQHQLQQQRFSQQNAPLSQQQQQENILKQPEYPEVSSLQQYPVQEETTQNFTEKEATKEEFQQTNYQGEILEKSEQQEFQLLDNKVSQEYLQQKLTDVANNDNTIERQFTFRDNEDDVLSHSEKSSPEEESCQQIQQQVMNQPEQIVQQHQQEDQNLTQLQPYVQQVETAQNQRKQSIDSDDQLMMKAQAYKASQDQLQAQSAQKTQQEESSHEGDSYEPEIDQDVEMEQRHDSQIPVKQNPQYVQNQQQAYSESKSDDQSDEDDSHSKVSEQIYRAQGPEHQQAQPSTPQVHHSRPTFGVKQPVSHHIEDDYSESELESEENRKEELINAQELKESQQQMIHPNQERYVSQSIQSSYSNEESEQVRPAQQDQHQTYRDVSEDDEEDLPSDSEFQNQIQQKKQQNHNIGQSLWGQHNQNQVASTQFQKQQEDRHFSEQDDDSCSSVKSSDEEADNQQPAQNQQVPQAYLLHAQSPAQQQFNQSHNQTGKNDQNQITTQMIHEAQNEPQSSVISPSKILQNIDNQNILNSYPNHHMMYNSEVKNTFNQSTVQQEQPCTFEVGQMVINHNNPLQSLSANQNDQGMKYQDQNICDDNSKITVEDFYPLIDPKIKNQIAAKVRLELQDEVKEKIREELTQTVTYEVQTQLKQQIEHETEIKVKQQVTLEITEKIALETEQRLKSKYAKEQQEQYNTQMEKFSKEKEEMAKNMKRLQEIIKSKENEMHQHELQNQQFVMTLNDKINQQNHKMKEFEEERYRQIEIKRQAEFAKQQEEESDRRKLVEVIEAQKRAAAQAVAELARQQEMERQGEIERQNVLRKEQERIKLERLAEQERIAKQERIRIAQLEALRKANEEMAQQEAAEAQRLIEAQRQAEALKQAELQRLLEDQRQQEISRQQAEAQERQKAELQRQLVLKAQEEERLAIERERQQLLRIQQQEKLEQQRQQEEEERLRKFEQDNRRQKEEEERQILLKRKEDQEKLRQFQVQKAEQEKAILIQKQEQLLVLMELKNQEEEQTKLKQRVDEQERMRLEQERLDKIREEMNQQEALRQQQIQQEEVEEMEQKHKDLQEIISMQTITVLKTDTNNSVEIVSMKEMKAEEKLSELQEKQKQLDELRAIQKQLEEEKQKSKLAALAEEKRLTDEKIIQAQAEKLRQLEIQNSQLMKQNQDIKHSQLSAQKSNHSAYSQNGIPVINLEDDNDIDDSPSKQKYLSHAKEESSYLPDIVPQEQLVKKREKIIKKVRFHDDDPVTVLPVDYQRAGTKRTLYKNSTYNTIEDDEDEDEQSIMDMEADECDEQFAKLQKVQKIEEQQVVVNIQREDRQARNMRRKTYSEDAYIYSDNDDDDWDRRDKRVPHKRKNKHDGKQTASTSKSGASPSTTEHGSNSKFSATSPFKTGEAKKEYDSKMSQHMKSIAPDAQKNPQLMKMLEKIAFKR